MHSFYQSSYFPMLLTVAVIQSVHMVEHIIQLAQVYVFGVSDAEAFGLLGYVFKVQGTEEWLHLGFNASFLAALYVLVLPLWSLVRVALPMSAFVAFVGLAVGLESWHVVEHIVIISNVIQNNGCPCAGIGDAALGVSDTVLHFGYNTLATAGLLIPAWFVWRSRPLHQPSARLGAA